MYSLCLENKNTTYLFLYHSQAFSFSRSRVNLTTSLNHHA